MTTFITNAENLKEYINSEQYLQLKDTIYYSGRLSHEMSSLHILGDFTWSNAFNMASNAKGLPNKIDGTLELTDVELWSCEGFPETVGCLKMNTTCQVLKWKGMENTTITCATNGYNIINLPEEGDIIYHPHIFKENFNLLAIMPKNKTRYANTDIFDYGIDKLNKFIKELLTENLSKNLLETL